MKKPRITPTMSPPQDPPEMTPIEALQILVQATGHPGLTLSRADTHAVEKALERIGTLIEENEDVSVQPPG